MPLNQADADALIRELALLVDGQTMAHVAAGIRLAITTAGNADTALQQQITALVTALDAHRTADPIDHPALSVTEPKLADGAASTRVLADESLTLDKITKDGVTEGQGMIFEDDEWVFKDIATQEELNEAVFGSGGGGGTPGPYVPLSGEVTVTGGVSFGDVSNPIDGYAAVAAFGEAYAVYAYVDPESTVPNAAAVVATGPTGVAATGKETGVYASGAVAAIKGVPAATTAYGFLIQYGLSQLAEAIRIERGGTLVFAVQPNGDVTMTDGRKIGTASAYLTFSEGDTAVEVTGLLVASGGVVGANISAAPGASKIPMAGGSGKLALGWLPVADDGETNSGEVVRSDDSRLSNARTPTAHGHPFTEITGNITDAQHGNRAGGSLHANATGSTAGFMSATDKTKLDAASATATASVIAMYDGSGKLPAAGIPAGIGLGQVANIVIVDAGGVGDYTTLSAAFSAITTANSSNQFLILVSGAVAETAVVTAKSYVHVVFLPGSKVTVTTTSTGHAISMSSLVTTTWQALDPNAATIIRAGAVSGLSHGINMGTCDATVRLIGLYVDNQTTGFAGCLGIQIGSASTCILERVTAKGSAGGTSGSGFHVTGSSNPTLIDSTGYGSAGGSSAIGIYINGGSPTLIRCTGYGGSAAGACHGMYISGSGGSYIDCRGFAGAGGGSCYGLALSNTVLSDTLVRGGYFKGGDGGDSCMGLYCDVLSSPTILNAIFVGGDGGNSCYGGYVPGGSSPVLTNCTFMGGYGGTSCIGLRPIQTAAPLIDGCRCYGGGVGRPQTATASYTSANSGRIQPSATKPSKLIGAIRVVVGTATAGATVQFGSTAAGTDLTASQSLAAVGTFYLPVIADVLIAAAGYFYATTTGAPADGTFTVTYTVEWSFASSYGLYLDSTGAVVVRTTTVESNCASDAAGITTNGDDRSLILGGVFRSGKRSTGRLKAINSAAAWNPAQIYNAVLEGGTTNITAAAGTANGSNIEL